ncbi:zinc finger protein 184-like isoform X1 [Trichoplusia ni]|uniref:Zinc finger protein 184-like isoform X1 n=1 Tax=Trichoplusia ni TaxID=7111 RepID=A0A7E5X613_TRINI|nr:zinc finger protein 184-like isoform X1 [Trichoplusia ni]XP_026748121.1 zinc finger protein 184-like isoform X1 [Trichoplusia ni]XP_026748122.1 zinc finger protein 184-like isoform X1 [Trichoplusia ni]XP_026748123.1 zinc finger protein 184-like isoform X1 [Trichoplusia ni]
MAEQPERYVNVVPSARLKAKPKKEINQDDEDSVHCRLCWKGFASEVALRNHARMEHIDAYASGDPSVWTQINVKHQEKSTEDNIIRIKTEKMLSEMEPTSVMALASKDVSYIIIKAEDGSDVKRRRVDRVLRKEREEKQEKQLPKKEKESEPITGPFECLQPSTLVADGTCHQIFFSCCEYSLHYRDEHTRRRKGLRCQVCEKPLACSGGDAPAPYACEVCGLGYMTNKDLSEHTAIAHVKLKPFECSVCHKRFTQHGGVLQHMRMHTGDRPFPCTFCPKAFTQKSGLDQHLRIHTKVKPYRCVVCNKTFCQSVHLKQHMRTHTNVAPFQCGICDKRFKQSSHLNYHLKNHNPAVMTEQQRAKYAELVGMMSGQGLGGGAVQVDSEVDCQWSQAAESEG